MVTKSVAFSAVGGISGCRLTRQDAGTLTLTDKFSEEALCAEGVGATSENHG
jgi:hypothetical protein